MPEPTIYQKQAIYFEKGNCLVSAGAGSGKTDVLTKRIYQLVKNNVCRLDQMLVLTFTNKAAFEMKQRARGLIAADPETRHLLPDVEQAAITTFDGFALSLVKTYHYELGIDEDVNIVDDAMMSVQRFRLIDEILGRHYEAVKNGGDPAFHELVKAFCVKDDSRIINAILNAYELAALKEDKRTFLAHYMDHHFTDAYFDAMMKDYLDYVRSLMAKLMEGFNHYNDTKLASYDSEFVTKNFGNCKTYQDYHDAFALNSRFATKPKKKEDEEPDDEATLKLRKFLVAKYWSVAKDCCRYASEEVAIESFAVSKPYIETICKLAIELIDEEERFMKKHACYRFDDIAMLARKLARNKEIQQKLRKTYTFIMVDEYQDTSDLQEDLINLISTGNTFCVGDIKQSIYRFRNANPALFTSKLNTYTTTSDEKRLITLPDNFRSREQVIRDINLIFSDIMTQEVGGAHYKAGHALQFGNHSYDATKDNEPYGVMAYRYQLDESMKREEQEATLIANDIIHKIKTKYLVKGENGGRPVGYGDFAILTSSKTIYDAYIRIFNQYGIPLAVSSEIELKEENIYFIMRNLFDFLLCLAKRKDDDHTKHMFASISRSFIACLEDKVIFEAIRNNTYREIPWVKTLGDYADTMYGNSISAIFVDVLKIFDIPSKIALCRNVISNYERIETLYEASKTGSSFGWGLEEFVAYFNDLTAYEIKLGQEIPPSDCDAVRLMTIHASKGLQFPVVYLPQLNKRFKVTIPGNDTKLTYDLRNGLILPNVIPNQRADSIATVLHDAHDNQENVSERMRLFYVALTRAQELAILIDSDADTDDNGEVVESVIDSIESSKSFRDFLHFVNKGIVYRNYDIPNQTPYHTPGSVQKRELAFKEINAIGKEIPPTIRPSKEIKGKVDEGALAFGTKLHRLLELTDLKSKDVSWIKDEKERSIIKRVLALPILQNLGDAKVYREYEFVDENGQKGIIDLLLVYEKEAVVVDYKTSNIDDDAYAKQLESYKRFVEERFKKPTRTYLLSILKAEVREVA